jgi:hypothetical protein
MPTPSRKSEIALAAVSAFTGRQTSPILPAAQAAIAVFDYRAVAELFPTRSEAEAFPAGSRRHRRGPVGYRRFARAADAIRFAIEELPAELLPEACLEVDEQLFDRDGIRRLYDSNDYPLARRAAPVRALGPVPTWGARMIRQSPRR